MLSETGNRSGWAKRKTHKILSDDSTPEPIPILVQIEFAGVKTTSVSDRGAAALSKVLLVQAIPFGDLGATPQFRLFAPLT